MQNLEAVCQQMSLPPVETVNLDGVTKLAGLILEQTKGQLKNNHRTRLRQVGLPSQIGEMLAEDLFTTWLNDRDKLPFDCKLQTFILTKLLQDKGVGAQVSYYRHGHHNPHPFVRISQDENSQILVGFAVGFDPKRGFYHDPDVVVQSMTEADKNSFNQDYYSFSDLNQAIVFGDLRQQYNIVYCDQKIDPQEKEKRLSQLSDQLWAAISD